MVLKLSFILTVLIQIGVPLGLGFWLARRAANAGVFTRKAAWGIFGVGVLTFIGSQVVHLPLLGADGAVQAAGHVAAFGGFCAVVQRHHAGAAGRAV